MVSINGHVSHPYFNVSQPNNANKDGMNGLIQALKRLNGQGMKIKNYYNWQEYFRHNGELSHHLLEEHQHNAMKDIKNYWIWHKASALNKLKI